MLRMLFIKKVKEVVDQTTGQEPDLKWKRLARLGIAAIVLSDKRGAQGKGGEKIPLYPASIS